MTLAADSGAAVTVRKDNPLCGDVIDLTVAVMDGRLDRVSHRARACSLVIASARILADVVPGLTLEEARDLALRVDRAMQGHEPLPTGFGAVTPAVLMPARRRCVLLAWHALRDVLDRS
jgi:NifU-like protein involved in Fe-S cluster formation